MPLKDEQLVGRQHGALSTNRPGSQWWRGGSTHWGATTTSGTTPTRQEQQWRAIGSCCPLGTPLTVLFTFCHYASGDESATERRHNGAGMLRPLSHLASAVQRRRRHPDLPRLHESTDVAMDPRILTDNELARLGFDIAAQVEALRAQLEKALT